MIKSNIHKIFYRHKKLSCTNNIILIYAKHRVFPGGPVGKTLHFQYRGPRFDLWSGNWIPHATTKSLHAAMKITCVLQLRPGTAKYKYEYICIYIYRCYIYVYEVYTYICELTPRDTTDRQIYNHIKKLQAKFQ